MTVQSIILHTFAKQNPERTVTNKHLIVEISGMSKDKAEKKWFVEDRWIAAVNALKEKYEYPEWHFIEIANDVRNIKNQLIEKVASL